MGRSRRGGVVLLLSALAAMAQSASVEGVVTNSVTGVPVSRAHVQLMPSGGGTLYGAMTDSEGRFAVSRMAAGTYWAIVEKAGFVTDRTVRDTIKLDAGEKKTAVKLVLVPGGIIAGRVLDANGEPLAGAVVSTSEATDTTDDEGRFRLHSLRAGRVKVAAQPFHLPLPPERRVDGTREVEYGRTFYPNSLKFEEGQWITVRAGAEADGIDIRLVAVPILKIAGRVEGVAEGGRASVTLRPVDAASGGGEHTMGQVRPDGSFDLWRVPPGKYWITAGVFGPSGAVHSAPQELTVESVDVENVELALRPPETIRGRIRWEGDPPSGSASKEMRLVLHPVTGMASMSRSMWDGAVKEDGSFTVEQVDPGKYRVGLMDQRGFVKSTAVGSRDGEGNLLDLSRGAGGEPVTLVLSTEFASVQGVVRRGGEPAANLRVMLVDEPASVRGPNSVLTGADGSYKIAKVLPGSYRLVVLEPEATWISGTPGAEGDRITLGSNEHAVRDVRYAGRVE